MLSPVASDLLSPSSDLVAGQGQHRIPFVLSALPCSGHGSPTAAHPLLMRRIGGISSRLFKHANTLFVSGDSV